MKNKLIIRTVLVSIGIVCGWLFSGYKISDMEEENIVREKISAPPQFLKVFTQYEAIFHWDRLFEDERKDLIEAFLKNGVVSAEQIKDFADVFLTPYEEFILKDYLAHMRKNPEEERYIIKRMLEIGLKSPAEFKLFGKAIEQSQLLIFGSTIEEAFLSDDRQVRRMVFHLIEAGITSIPQMQAIAHLFTRDMNGYNRVEIIAALAQGKIKSTEDIMRLAKLIQEHGTQLFEEKSKSELKVRIIATLAKQGLSFIPNTPEFSQALYKYKKKIFKGLTDPWMRQNLTVNLIEGSIITEAQILSFVNAIEENKELLFNKKMPSRDVEFIKSALTNGSYTSIEQISVIAHIVSGKISGFHKSLIIDALKEGRFISPESLLSFFTTMNDNKETLFDGLHMAEEVQSWVIAELARRGPAFLEKIAGFAQAIQKHKNDLFIKMDAQNRAWLMQELIHHDVIVDTQISEFLHAIEKNKSVFFPTVWQKYRRQILTALLWGGLKTDGDISEFARSIQENKNQLFSAQPTDEEVFTLMALAQNRLTTSIQIKALIRLSPPNIDIYTQSFLMGYFALFKFTNSDQLSAFTEAVGRHEERLFGKLPPEERVQFIYSLLNFRFWTDERITQLVEHFSDNMSLDERVDVMAKL